MQEEAPPNPVPTQKVEEVSKPVAQRPQQPIVKEVVKTFEEMRKDRLKELSKQRETRNADFSKQVF